MNFPWDLWLEQFHFLRPDFLWLLPISLMVYWVFTRVLPQTTSVNNLFNPVLLAYLTQNQTSEKSIDRKPKHTQIVFALCLATLALAGPTVQQIPQPTYQAQIGQVIIMDMSLSMRATDLKPNRLSQARFKAMDYIQANPEANIGLVAYAGDAFVISPITQDGKNLTALIPSLRPELMPVFGSEPEYAFIEAFTLLAQAGYQQGHVLWLTDGVDYAQIPALTSLFRDSDYSVSIIAVGTENGAPIQQRDGQLLKDNSGAIVIPRVNLDELAQLARVGNGVFTGLLPNNDDIDAIKATLAAMPDDVTSILETQNDKWYELGPYLLIPVIVMILWGMRPQLLLLVCLTILYPSSPPVYAQAQGMPPLQNSNELSNAIVPPPSAEQSIVAKDPLNQLPDLLKNKSQQALSAYQAKDFESAAELFTDPQWQANAFYQQGQYDRALPLFEQDTSAIGRYNTGNTFAALQQYEAALAAYEEAISTDPDLQIARDAKEALELFLENMPPQQQQQDGNDQNSDEQNSQEGEEQQSQDSQAQDGSDGEQQEQQQNQQQQNSTEQNNAESENNSTQNEDTEQTDSENTEQEDQSQQDKNNETEPDPTQEAMQSMPQELSPEQREQQERMQSLLNKVPDDPGFLLQRKMQLEYQKRQRQRLPNSLKKEW